MVFEGELDRFLEVSREAILLSLTGARLQYERGKRIHALRSVSAERVAYFDGRVGNARQRDASGAESVASRVKTEHESADGDVRTWFRQRHQYANRLAEMDDFGIVLAVDLRP